MFFCFVFSCGVIYLIHASLSILYLPTVSLLPRNILLESRLFQLALKQTADNHIFKFLKNKIVRDNRDFETQLYLCNEAFKECCTHFSQALQKNKV